MTTAIEKLDELLAIIRNRMIEVKGLQEKEVDETEEEKIEQSEQEELPQHPDTDYLIKVFNHLKELGYINTQYEFSERFLNKNKYYYGMILSEHRHP